MAQHRRILGISAACVLSVLFPPLSRAGTWVAFQNSYTRGTGSPVTVTSTFTLLNPNTQYTLKAFNGGLQNDTTELVSYSVVYLNGAQAVGPANFNQTVAEVNVSISPGLTNTLSVQVRGKPGGVLTIQVIGGDNDPPTITASVSPSPNAAGWNNSPVTVSFACSDKTSGVASCPSPVNVGTEGANQVVSGTATDLAGNTATTSVTINLDMTPPTVTGTINPPPDAGGYNSGPVTVTFACTDALSGVASCSPAVSVTNEGSASETGTAVDVAGNTASTTVTVNISFNYFKIRSWQTNPAGDPSQTGKCLDYGTSPRGNGATVFLNDCANAHSIRVLDISLPPNSPRVGSGGTSLGHEVMLFAGNGVIGVSNPLTISPGATTTSPPPQPVTEYQLAVQAPFFSPRGSAVFTAAQQIWRLDGDSIILEGSHLELQTNTVLPISVEVPGPCINTATSTTVCPPPLPQLVIQSQNSRGANGSPLVAAVRNLSDNEFWDFVATDGSGKFPTDGFISQVGGRPITTNWQLWNALCTPQVVASIGSPVTAGGVPLIDTSTTPGTAVACSPNVVWGNVVVVAGNDPSECTGNVPTGVGPCIDLSAFPPITLPAGVAIRGSRRGTNFGPQLFDQFPTSTTKPSPYSHCEACMIEVQGDYARVTGLRLRGQSRATDQSEPGTEGINVGYPGQPLGSPTFAPTTLTELISTIDHNDMSDWGAAAITIADAYSAVDPTDNDATNQSCTFTVTGGSTSYPCTTISDEDATLANVHVARNFLHHNQRDNDGYGVGVGRALIEGNTFAWDRHAIASGGEPHNEYRAAYNLVLSVKSTGDQDFDMHGINHPGHGYGGPGGYYVNILGNTFLGTNRQNYWLRGNPIVNNDFDGNVSLRNETDAIHFIDGYGLLGVLCCTHTYPGPPFPINLSGNQFADSSAPYTDPTTRLGPASLGVGDFDGDGDDDLFLTTGASWYYSPAGAREWRFLSAKVDRIDTLLLGDFDGDGRTDVVGMNPSGQFDVSWGGISDWEVINQSPCANGVPNPCPTSIQNMVVGDFDGDGKPDILYADKIHWYISYGGTMPFAQVNDSSFLVQDLRFGHFAICGSGAETDVFSVQNTGWYVSCGATTPWQLLGAALTKTVLVVADFNGDGSADVLAPSSDGWQISYGGTQPWTDVPQPFGIFTFVAIAGVGHFTEQPQTDVLVWNGLGIVSIVTGTELLLSAAAVSPATQYSTQDMR